MAESVPFHEACSVKYEFLLSGHVCSPGISWLPGSERLSIRSRLSRTHLSSGRRTASSRLQTPIPLAVRVRRSAWRDPSMFRRLSALVHNRSHATRLQFRPRPAGPDSRLHADQAQSAPAGTRPVSTNLQRAITSLRAKATIITRRILPFAPPHRSLNHLLSALSG